MPTADLLGESCSRTRGSRVLDQLGRVAALAGQRRRRSVEPHAMLELVQVVQRSVGGSNQRMPMSSVCSTSRSLSPTRSTMPWKSSSRGHALLHAVDHRQLGVALFGFLQQALRLVEQAGVFQRHAHARGHGGEQAHFGFAEGVFALVVLDVMRRAHGRCRRSALQTDETALVGARHAVIPAPPSPRPCSRRSAGASAVTLRQPPSRAAAADRAGARRARTRRGSAAVRFGVEPADADVAGAEHLPQLVAHQIDDGLEVQLERPCPAGCC